jgi:hypothetical protein
MARKVADGIEQDLRFRCAKAFLGREWAEYANGAHSGAARHFDVFRRIAYIDAMFGLEAHASERQLKWRRMRLLFWGVLTAYTCGKVAGEREFADLAANPRAVSAADNAEFKFRREGVHDAPGAQQQRRFFELVGLGPETVGLRPFRTRYMCRAVDAKPVRRIMRGDFALGPVDIKGAEHGKVGADVRGVGIEQRAIPVEKNGAGRELEGFHGEGIVSERGAVDKRLGLTASARGQTKNHVNCLTQRSQ